MLQVVKFNKLFLRTSQRIALFCAVNFVVNQAGETALDTAKRVKAVQCEELVRTGPGGKGKGGCLCLQKCDLLYISLHCISHLLLLPAG